ncbi:hypothetical protein FRUB_05108 [Fimbriiglobus ruber]|uniref:Carboxypeptidase regulatory-like domain-containing protein n=1 Tax=Fimbriiglobus ruber TaxID=1908690 RepID=A0A225DSL9_9BACT|nr:hypothetical protein FRUB_05108 [Fimbriiglobus ruber]
MKGRILAKGAPVGHAKLFLVPVGREDPEALRPRATTSSDGSFVISTYASGDGAPVGEYAVGITWRGPHNQASAKDANPAIGAEESGKDFGKDEGRFDLFKNRYRDPKSSGIKIKVDAAPTVVPDIDLK